MKLAELTHSLQDIIVDRYGDMDPGAAIHGIAYDSRKVKPGFIFVAIAGALTDGHRYLEQAKMNGAMAAIVEIPADSYALPAIRVSNSRLALSHLAAAWFDHPSRRMLMTGITGSNGKTTTANMLDTIFKESGEIAGLLGTIFYRIGEKQETADLTTPESLELHGILKTQADHGFKRTIMEVSSIAIEQCRVADIDYNVMAFNNITREHIDQHGSFAKYVAAKTSLMKRLTPDAIAVLGADDPIIMEQCAVLDARTITFGLENKQADVYAKNLDLSSGVGTFTMRIQRDIPTLTGTIAPCEVPVALNVPGLTSVYNALSAMCMAMAQGYTPLAAAQGVGAYLGVERRFQRVFAGDYQIYDDHYGNAGNVRMTLQTIGQMSKQKLHLAFAVRGNRGVTVNREIAEEMARWKDLLPWGNIIISLSRDVTTAKDLVTEDEANVLTATLADAGYAFTVVETLKEAMTQIVDAAEPGDVVILGGAQGMDPGARIALNYLATQHPEWDEATLMAPLVDRVCG